ncbi:MAG: 50S ribosomal protein L9 [Omnitrophica bacterium RIFCSPLOWO2_01_FULL_45_10]|nr:MAG: 50S ribosomal protein L9 [Omnitrophica bacterium RIFCSPLOWO2_01_FULL_45_10]
MKIILLENIDRLGKTGDIVMVKEGYGRNYLIPKNKAKPATPGNMKILESLREKEAEEINKKLGEAKALADKISGLSLTINVESGEEEKLFGSVSNATIQDALAQEGINIDKKDIILDEPIKKLGVYQVVVNVHPEVKADLRVWVVKK